MPKASVLLVLLSAAGCSWSQDFELADLEKIRLGETSFEEAKRILKSEERYTGHFFSTGQTVIPPAPLSWISWPLVLYRHGRAYRVDLQWDERRIVSGGSLEISETESTNILLFFGPGDDQPKLTEGEIEQLRRLQNSGLEVRVGVTPIRCFGGILGWQTVPLDDYLGLGD